MLSEHERATLAQLTEPGDFDPYGRVGPDRPSVQHLTLALALFRFSEFGASATLRTAYRIVQEAERDVLGYGADVRRSAREQAPAARSSA